MKRAILGFILVVLLSGGIFYNVRSRNQPPAIASADELQSNVSARSARAKVPVPVHQPPTKLTLTGIVKAERQAAVSAKVPARITAVPVRQGDRVSAGQVLIRLDDRDVKSQAGSALAALEGAIAHLNKAIAGKRVRKTEMEGKVSEAKAGLVAALSKLHQAELGLLLTNSSALSDAERADSAVRQAEAGIKQANIAVTQAEDTAKRLKFLYDHGGLARVDLEGAVSQLEIALAQRDSARAALEQARAAAKPAADAITLRKKVSEADVDAARAGARQAEEGLKAAHRTEADALAVADRDIESARSQVSQSRIGLEQARSQALSATIITPIEGTVTEVLAHQGELAQPGQPLITVVSMNSVFVEASVPSRQALLVRVGSKVKITADNVPWKAIAGEVARILPTLTDGRTVTVHVRLVGNRAGLLPGLEVGVEIAVGSGR
jgi:multidrug resistance efflux pump